MSRKIAIEITPPLLFPGLLVEDKNTPGIFKPNSSNTEDVKINGIKIDTIEHIGTEFLGSKEIYFKDTSKLLINETIRKDTQNVDDPEYPKTITKLITKVNIDKDQHLYVKTRLIFKINGNEVKGDYSRVSVISGYQKGFTVSDSIVNTPLVEVELENGLKLSTKDMSAFIGSNEHKDTTWEIRTSNGELKYSRKNDIDNKTVIKPNFELTKNKMYIAEVVHNNLVNVKSNIGRKLFLDKLGGKSISMSSSDINSKDLLDTYSFSLETPFMYKTDVYYKVKIHIPYFRFYEIEIREADHTTVRKRLGSLNKYINFFNTSDLELNKLYTIYGRLHRVDGTADKNHDDGQITSLEATEWKLLYMGSLLANDGRGDNTDVIGDGTIEYPPLAEVGVGPVIDTGSFLHGVDIQGNPISPDDLDKNNDGLNDVTNQMVLRRVDRRSYTTYEFKDGTIIVPEYYSDTTVMLYLYRFDNNVLRRVKPMLSTPLVVHPIDHITFIPLPGNQICVVYNTNGTGGNYKAIKVSKYLYNPVTKMLQLKNTIDIKDNQVAAKYSTTLSSSTAYDNNGNIYILGNTTENVSNNSKNTIKLFKVVSTVNNLTLTTHNITLPGNTKIHYFPTMFRDADGEIYLTGGVDITANDAVFTHTDKTETYKRTNDKIFKLNKSNNTFTDTGYSLPLNMSKNIYSLQAMLRKDHKVVMFNSVYNGIMVGVQEAFVYDTKTGVTTTSTILDNIKAPFLSNINLVDGGIIRITTKEDNPQLSYIYRSNISEGSAGTLNSYVNKTTLHVRNYETIEIEDAYKYEEITIEPHGTLVWADTKEIRTFRGGDLIITRDKTMTQSEIDSVTGTLFLLDGVNLTIQENA